MTKRKKLSRWQRWAKANPEKAERHKKRRRLRRDRRDRTLWHRRLRVLMLHCGEFCTRKRDQLYACVEVRLTVIELARVWFRDKAYLMKRPHLDRVDPEGHYEFSNVRFVEDFENYARRRTNGSQPADEEVPF